MLRFTDHVLIHDETTMAETGANGKAAPPPALPFGGVHSPDIHSAHIPEPLGYRLKNAVLGPPLHSEQLVHERLGKPTALAVFASDNLSSCAYATEEILRVLVPYVGLAAFTLVTPITVALLVVLGFLILSYRQTIKAYPSAGGAYIVTRDNFGLMPAQVAGVALLTDYVLTVAVSVAAGSDALASAIAPLAPFKHWIAIGFVVLIAYGNLRGTKESGKLFAAPTYFFIVNMLVLLSVGGYKLIFSSLPKGPTNLAGMEKVGAHSGSGLLMGATVFIVLKAFGSGGAAVTGVEAISNGVPAFREPAWKNARRTLVVMGTLLGVMFLGLSILAAHTHAMPYQGGTPTVISQVGDFVYGRSGLGRGMFYLLQAGTMLILVLAANTSFADFPRLASFHAGDNFMPRQFMIRGHRLVFSNGIMFLAAAAIVTLLATGGEVSRLIPLYAIGVFTSFTLSQSGMAKHHIRLKEQGWKSGLVINAILRGNRGIGRFRPDSNSPSTASFACICRNASSSAPRPCGISSRTISWYAPQPFRDVFTAPPGNDGSRTSTALLRRASSSIAARDDSLPTSSSEVHNMTMRWDSAAPVSSSARVASMAMAMPAFMSNTPGP